MRTTAKPSRRHRSVSIPSGFAWLKDLDSNEQASFISGLLARVLGATKKRNWAPVSEWIEEWQATANVLADSEVARRVKRGRAELATGEWVDWETLRKELSL